MSFNRSRRCSRLSRPASAETWTSEAAGEPVRLTGSAVNADFFQVVRRSPLLGHFFVPEDRKSAVLSYGTWETQYGGDPSAIGGNIVLARAHRGSGAGRLALYAPRAVWTSLVLDPQRFQRRGWMMTLALCARVKGVRPEQAPDCVNGYVSGLKSAAGGAQPAEIGYFIDLTPFSNYVAGDLRRPLLLLWGGAGALLLTGCAIN